MWKYASVIAFLLELLVQEGSSRAIYIPGTVSETQVNHFEFIQRLGNPCRIMRLESSEPETMSYYSVNYQEEEDSNNTQFYKSVLIDVDTGLEKLRLLHNSDPGLPECKGLRLDTLPPFPPTPILATLSDDQLFGALYKSGVYLSAHLHIMNMDRQMTVVGVNDVSDDDIDEHDDLPLWRYLRCGNESDSFMLRLAEMTLQMENFLCTVVSSANLEQRTMFREPFNKLLRTTFFRYHSTCSSLQMRDCLVLSEAKRTLQAISAQFNMILQNQIGAASIYSQILTNDI